MAFPDESAGVVVAWDNETKTGWAKDEYMCKDELVFLDSKNCLDWSYQDNEYPKIGDEIQYSILYKPEYNYANAIRKLIRYEPPIFTEQELQERQKQQKIDKIVDKFGKIVWFLYIGSIIFCALLLVFMWMWSWLY